MSKFGQNNGARAFGVLWLCFTLPFYVIGTFTFLQRRHMQPIRARFPMLIVLGNFFFILFTVNICIKHIWWDKFPCLLELWQTYLFGTCIGLVYAIRCFLLFFKFEITHERIAMATTAVEAGPANRAFGTFKTFRHQQGASATANEKKSFKFMDNSYLASSKFLVPLMIGLALFELCFVVIVSIVEEDFDGLKSRDEKCPDTGKWASQVIIIFNLIYIITFVVFGFKLRRVFDNFWLKNELRLTGYNAILIFVCWVPWVLIGGLKDWQREQFPVPASITLVFLFIVFCISTIYPTYLTFQPQGDLLVSDQSTLLSSDSVQNLLADPHADTEDITLESVIETHDGFKSFQNFLAGEFSVENLLFWKDVREYVEAFDREDLDHGDMVAWAHELYDAFVSHGSPMEVNLPGEIVKKIDESLGRNANAPLDGASPFGSIELNSVSIADKVHNRGDDASSPATKYKGVECKLSRTELKSLYDLAKRNIFRLMDTDSFSRYKASSHFTNLMKAIRGARRKKQVLKDMDLVDD